MRLLRKLRAVFWLPYALCFRHRTTLSHFPVICTMTRLLYIGTLVLLIAWRLGVDFGSIPHLVERGALAAVIGVTVSEIAHALADCWPPRLRRSRRR